MGFAGNLRTLSLGEVLQTLNRIQATGTLKLASSDGGREVFFDKGEIIGVGYRPGSERQALLRRLILEGTISPEDAANISSDGRDDHIVASLLDDGIINPADLAEAQHRQSEDELYNLTTWEHADFVFHDAGPETPEVEAQIASARTVPMTIPLNSLLMEAARRLDEWDRHKLVITHDEIIFGPAEGHEADLAKAAEEYPAKAVVPLVDAVRTVGEIISDCVATRLDVYAVLAELYQAKHLALLSREDIIYHGDYLVSQSLWAKAAKLFRQALAEDAADTETTAKLASCLEKVGGGPEAAACYGQLALAHLADSRPDQAADLARKAINLSPDDLHLRLSLVRCLLGQDDHAGAILELRELVVRYQHLGQLEDARGTCLKILEIDGKDVQARRELARIYSEAGNDPDSEDVVVCVGCGQVNHREAANCEKCKASLHLSCLSCGRVVGVSDRICIFCGADPHNRSQRGQRREAGGSPATSRVISPEHVRSAVDSAIAEAAASAAGGVGGVGAVGGGSGLQPKVLAPGQRFRNELEENISKSSLAEAEGDVQLALDHWKAVVKIQPESPEVQARLRHLEALVHDVYIEKEIERGHQLKRVRRLWAASKAYRNALSGLTSDDPRVPRLREILAATVRNQQIIAVVYAAGFLVLLAGAYVVAKPYQVMRNFRRDVTEVEAWVSERENLDARSLIGTKGDVDRILDAAEKLPSSKRTEGKRLADDLEARFRIARIRKAAAAREDIGKSLDREDLVKAAQGLHEYRQVFKDEGGSPAIIHLGERLTALNTQRSSRETQLQDAPVRLAAAEVSEQEGRLAKALSDYRGLSQSISPEVAVKAKESAVRLETLERAFLQEWKNVLAGTDLTRIAAALDGLEPKAKQWARSEELAARRAEVKRRLDGAASAFLLLADSNDPASLETFITAHAGTPQVEPARTKLAALRLRGQVRDQAVARFNGLMEQKEWEKAWQAGRDLIATHGSALPAGSVKLPLVIECFPPGATVRLDGRNLGPAPVVVTYSPASPTSPGATGATGTVTLELSGFIPISRPLAELTTAWRTSAVLVRQSRWKTDLGKPAFLAHPLALPNANSGLLISSGEALCLLDVAGTVQWRVSLGGDELSDPGRSRYQHVPVLLPDGRLVVGAPGRGVVILDRNGRELHRQSTTAQVRGRPLVYVNDSFGPGQRLAYAAESVSSGELGSAPTFRFPLDRPALAGPLAITRGLDQILVVVTVDCQVIGLVELASTKRPVWSLNLQAGEVGQLNPLGNDGALAVLDGSRLVCLQLRPDGASIRWSQQLSAPAVGEPAVANGIVYLAGGRRVERIGVDGGPLESLLLPAPASSPAAARDNVVAVGCTDGTLAVFRAGKPAWTTPCGAAVTTVAVTAEAVVAGLANGQVVAYSP